MKTGGQPCTWGRAAAGLLTAGLLGCTGMGAGPRPGPPPPPVGVEPAAEAVPQRQLFRVSYRGPEGSGALRLALLVADRANYQARASDRFGRALWSLELAGAEARFVDHRQRRFCVGGREARIAELALEALPLDRLPDVLASRLPAAPRRAGDDPDDFLDDEGRRWTAKREGGALEAWTLWSEGRPLLWWRRQEDGGILSHGRGSQFRWRRAVAEPLAAPLPALPIPDGYQATDCDTLAAAANPAGAGG